MPSSARATTHTDFTRKKNRVAVVGRARLRIGPRDRDALAKVRVTQKGGAIGARTSLGSGRRRMNERKKEEIGGPWAGEKKS